MKRPSATTLFACMALLVPLVVEARASVEPPFPSGDCRYLQAGPPGAAGNRLFIDDNYGGVGLRREGDEIVVFSPYSEEDHVLACDGPQATVYNIDRIVYAPPGGGDPPRIAHQLKVDLSGGIFQPGAGRDHSRGGGEIEIFADFPRQPHDRWSSIFVKGSDLDDWMRIGALSRGRTGVNLDLRRDHGIYDADLIVSAAEDAHFSLRGEGGNDRIGATGRGAEFEGPIRQRGLEIRGGDQRDLIYAGPERDVIDGGRGGDTIYGEEGRDRLLGGEGNDRLFGGAGDDEIAAGSDELNSFYDFLSGGRGRDALHAIDRNRDTVQCGPGPDHAYIDVIDEWSRSTCEKQHGPDFN